MKMSKKSVFAAILAIMMLLLSVVAGAESVERIVVTYDYNGSGVAPTTRNIDKGATANMNQKAVWYGYSLVGWGLDAEGKTMYDGAALEADTTLFAIWEAWDAQTAEWMAYMQEEVLQAKYIIERPVAYEAESFKRFWDEYAILRVKVETGEALTAETVKIVDTVKAAREALIQVCDPESVSWYIWENDMPKAPDADSYNYYTTADYEGFKPFLTPYLLDSQENVKGNIIIIAGGGYANRNNVTEGWPIAEAFNARGYNAFVLQRRVTPSLAQDTYLDLQRAVRYLKYYAEEKGIANIDKMATIGFSGGAGTISGQLINLYGDVSPTTIYADYVPDEIDQVNADYPAAILVYGGSDFSTTANENLPSTLLIVGDEDGARTGSLAAYNSLRGKVNLELHIFASAPHGFGLGTGHERYVNHPMENFSWMYPAGYRGADQWMNLADAFLMVEFGNQSRTYNDNIYYDYAD